jgi:hypothetical protein|uniref:C2H2-type domain-containing protein n=1 Tax=Sipha flava TaxID=143950 RepID=A0A2S2PYR5_9HEMI
MLATKLKKKKKILCVTISMYKCNNLKVINSWCFYFSGINLMAQCPKCYKMFENNKILFAHLMNQCGDELKFQCKICPLKFKQLHLLKFHMLSKHKVLHT